MKESDNRTGDLEFICQKAYDNLMIKHQDLVRNGGSIEKGELEKALGITHEEFSMLVRKVIHIDKGARLVLNRNYLPVAEEVCLLTQVVHDLEYQGEITNRYQRRFPLRMSLLKVFGLEKFKLVQKAFEWIYYSRLVDYDAKLQCVEYTYEHTGKTFDATDLENAKALYDILR